MLRLRPFRSYMIRSISSNSTGGKVFPPLKSIEEIKTLLNTPTWNIHKELIESSESEQSDIEINKELIDKVLKMSGLELVNESEIIKKLKEQVVFVNKLHEVEVTSQVEKVETENISLVDLVKNIHEQQPDSSKGELGEWEPTKLAEISKNEFYIVREGLIKK